MASTWMALDIGLSALQASQLGVDITGHNVANASTPGYARQTANLATATSVTTFTHQVSYIGQGVDVNGVSRQVNEQVLQQYRSDNAQQSYWDSQSTELNNVAGVFNEPTGTTLRSAIDGFFNAWNQLAQTPADGGARAAALQASKTVADAFQTTNSALQAEQTRYTSELSDNVDAVNTMVSSLASLNKQIEQGQAIGASPNDLLDQRDQLLDKLSSYAGIQVKYQKDTTNPSVSDITVSLQTKAGSPFGSSVTLVQDGNVVSTLSSSSPSAVSASAGTSGGTANTVNVGDLQSQYGTLSSLSDLTNYTGNVMGQVNQLAYDFTKSVDYQYSQGYGESGTTGKSLFNSASLTAANAASNIAVDPSLGTATLDQLAAASSTTAGGINQTDGNNAAAIAQLMGAFDNGGTVKELGTGGTATSVNTPGYASIVTQLGIDGQAATQKDQTFTALTTQASQMRQSVSGVDINQEMTNMVEYQQTYSAASKFISVYDAMLQTLISEV